MINVNLLFRSSKTGEHSIENVFSAIAACESGNGVCFEKSYLPCVSASPLSIVKNCLFARDLTGDIVHMTGAMNYAILAVRNSKTVLTIHDVESTMARGSGIKRVLLKLLWYELPLKHCDAITAVSDCTCDELKKYFPKVANDNIVVIPDPIDEMYYKAASRRQSVANPVPVFLQVGTRLNKNLFRVIEALRGVDCILDIIGPLDSEQVSKLEDARINYRNSVNVSNEEMVSHYVNCDCVLFFSTYEGFGMPVIEAQAIGKPVLTSDIHPIVDIAGDHLLFADPFDVEAMRAMIELFLEDAECVNVSIANGRENAERFRPSVIAEQYAKLYQELIE